MIKLKEMILQLKDSDCQQVIDKLIFSKADKILYLFSLMRENKFNDEEIVKKLDVKQSAYYTLKSRLYDKVQDFLVSNLDNTRTNLLNIVSNIPNLIYNTPRETAIVILKKLEQDLKRYDLPYELSCVYSALKKLHMNSAKYFEYSQQHNKHLAYAATLNKSEDLMLRFSKMLGEYDMSRESSLIDILTVIKKEMESLSLLHESHHLAIHKNIVDISYALFLPASDATNNDASIEDMLSFLEKTLLQHYKKSAYKFMLHIHSFLKFEYYMKVKQYKNARVYYESVQEALPLFLQFNFHCYTSKYLISRLEYAVIEKTENKLSEENELLFHSYKPDYEDLPGYVNLIKYQTICFLLNGNISEALNLMKGLMNTVSTRNFSHAEVELKLLLAYLNLLAGKFEAVASSLKNVSRKIKELNVEGKYEHALLFSKMLKTLISPIFESQDGMEKLIKLRNQFRLYNETSNRMLQYVPMDDAALTKLCKIK